MFSRGEEVINCKKSSPKPSWLDKKINLGACHRVRTLLRDLHLHTVCEESSCPNMSECFLNGVVTFMILGDVCSRKCSFCGIKKGRPPAVNPGEPKYIKEAVKKLGLDYVVITSPTRDDLSDGGVHVFCETVKEIMSIDFKKKVEILIPDFLEKKARLEKIAHCGAQVIAHNLETVPSLYPKVRKGADYNRSLRVLRRVKEANKDIFTKSGLMLGLGEKDEEVFAALRDLRRVDCDFLTLGQYLPPSLAHYPLGEYINPDKFNYFKEYAINLGFRQVRSSPYTRSSYMAHTFF